MDRERVVTASLHDAQVEVTVVWLDMPSGSAVSNEAEH